MNFLSKILIFFTFLGTLSSLWIAVVLYCYFLPQGFCFWFWGFFCKFDMFLLPGFFPDFFFFSYSIDKWGKKRLCANDLFPKVEMKHHDFGRWRGEKKEEGKKNIKQPCFSGKRRFEWEVRSEGRRWFGEVFEEVMKVSSKKTSRLTRIIKFYHNAPFIPKGHTLHLSL